ncbi:nucleotidyltransferase family protein [Thermovibrio sp.]
MPRLRKVLETEEIVSLLLEYKKKLQKEYGVKHLKIFGSYARNEQNKKSDLDLIVSLDGKVDLLGVCRSKTLP